MLYAGSWCSFGHYIIEDRHHLELCAAYFRLFLYSSSEKVRLTVLEAAVSVDSEAFAFVIIDDFKP